jgi:hypothetical protein
MEQDFAEQSRVLLVRHTNGTKLLSTFEASLALITSRNGSEAREKVTAAIACADPVTAYSPSMAPFHYLRVLIMILGGEHEYAARAFAEVLNALLFDLATKLPVGDRLSADAILYLVQSAANDIQVVGILKRLNEIGKYYKSFSNLATDLMSRDPIASYPLVKAAYVGRKSAIGPNHDETLLAAHKLAIVLGVLGQHPAALELNRYVFEQRESRYGFKHVLTLRSANVYANALFNCSEREAALALMRKAVEASIRLSGANHQQTRILQNNLEQLEHG